jgi:signal transduction histidine kinase
VQLQQVVLNLVLNALEALSPPWSGARTVVIRTARDGDDTVTVAVHDSGAGITEKDTDRIFEPLYTTKPEGLGMGLAIARTIVAAHGGRLMATNDDQGGATVRFTLPVGH